MKVLYKISIILLVIVSVAACKTTKVAPTEGAVEAKLVNLSGLDGCSWAIELEDGSRLEPLNLKEFDITKKKNKKVWITYENTEGYVSICMVGPIVKITSLTER